MKSVYSAAFAALFVLFQPQAQAACVSGTPDGGTLSVYSVPDASGPVMGGIGAGECNIEVSNQCTDNGFCQIYLGSLSGWVDMRYISVKQGDIAPSKFVYQVTGGDGSVTMAGMKQPTPVQDGGQITFTPANNDMIMTMPPALGSPPVRLKRTGSSSFSGTLSNWGGFPMKVEVIAEKISAPHATLEFFGKSDIAQMEMKLNLRRSNMPKKSSHLNKDDNRLSSPSLKQRQKQWQKRNQSNESAQMGAPKAPSGLSHAAQKPQPQNKPNKMRNPQQQSHADAALCASLSDAIRPILRSGRGSQVRADLMRVLRAAGIFDVTSATERQCHDIAFELLEAGILSDDQMDLSQSPFEGMGGPDPEHYAKNPNQFYEGNKAINDEIAGSEQDFVPLKPASGAPASATSSAPSSTPSSTTGQAPNGHGSMQSIPTECVALMDVIVKVLSNKNDADIHKLKLAVLATSLNRISGRSGAQCSYTMRDFKALGLGQ